MTRLRMRSCESRKANSGASTAFTIGELVRQIKNSEAGLLLCSKEYEERTVAAAKQCHVPPDRILVIDSSTPKDWRLLSSDFSSSNVLQSYNGRMLEWQRFPALSTLENTTTCLLYSSGTTGLPKGVLLSHWNLVSSNICSMHVGSSYIEQQGKQNQPFIWRTLACLPMAHIAGIQQYSINPFYMGGTTYWMPKYDFDRFISSQFTKREPSKFSLSPSPVPPIPT